MQKDLVVQLIGGLYSISTPLQFGPQDSGFNGYTVRYEAQGAAPVVISGGVPILNWTLNDSTKNIYQAKVPSGFDTRQLYVNGVRASRARLVIQAPTPGNPILGGGAKATIDGYAITIPNMTSWSNVKNIEAVTNSWWVQQRCPVDSITSGQIMIQNPCWALANATNRIVGMKNGINWLENNYAFLNESGQWYLDRSANLIYYIPRPAENLTTATVVASAAEQLITGSGSLDSSGNPQFVQNITFQGLTFAYTTWLQPNTSMGFAEIQSGEYSTAVPDTATTRFLIPGAVRFSRAKNITFTLNQFVHLGGAGLNIDTGSQNMVIQGNVFSDISAGGITVGDPDDNLEQNPKLQSVGHAINNNYLTQTGAEYAGTASLLILYTADTVIQNNEIANAPYTGLSIGWGFGASSYAANNQVNQNYVHDVVQTLFDGGGIYTLGSGSGTTLRGNYVTNVGNSSNCAQANAYVNGYSGYAGIYHDDASDQYRDSGNVVRNVACGGYWVFLQPGVTNVELTSNYVDVDLAFLCPGGHSGPSSCLNSTSNSITSLTVFGSAPTTAAQGVMSNAGLTSPYQNIKSGIFSF
ncbi:MAG: right-handed parallel beta-helix repeat-containing protein [Pseudomonadota bacterium]|nr:right-handed parallel beta-helix repeat-containing protein [Pseudomonadota bacterium]